MTQSMGKRIGAAALCLLGIAAASGPAMAQARPVTDCPLRDRPFSLESPLIDVLLNPQARRLTEAATGHDFSKTPPEFTGTTPPTFAAILTVRKFSAFIGVPEAVLPALDRQLGALPVTAEDRKARCQRYDNDRPVVALPRDGKPRLLLFEKIVGFKDTPSVNAAHTAFLAMAQRKGWHIVVTDKAGAFNPGTLRQVDAVIWNNISGDVLTLAQRKAFRSFLERGGGFVGVHGTAGDPAYFWDWYPDTLLGVRFTGHPMSPQLQEARVAVDKAHPLAKALPTEWRMTDEWYSFSTNPRSIGAKVLLTLDETTYTPVGIKKEDLRMGDHPLAWTNCIGKGRMFYSAIGHAPETYSHPQNVTMLEAAIDWAANKHSAC
ncbi:ThuA domain-containing protein [Blastomonas fulva]|jgi:type 1 glutamine amidotransferase|uniref:ThuA domain-containing protein n=1 Tax=Blastomonas fulva TaxID=1550728 RepID=UPI003D28ACC8